MIENFGAWHKYLLTKANGFGGLDTELRFNDPPRVKHIKTLAEWSKEKVFGYGGPR